jgi:hypothetical protein
MLFLVILRGSAFRSALYTFEESGPKMESLWKYFVGAILALGLLVTVRNSRRMRSNLGDNAHPEDIRKLYPRAKVLPLVQTRPSSDE